MPSLNGVTVDSYVAGTQRALAGGQALPYHLHATRRLYLHLSHCCCFSIIAAHGAAQPGRGGGGVVVTVEGESRIAQVDVCAEGGIKG